MDRRVKRQYTICNCLTKEIYDQYLRAIRRELNPDSEGLTFMPLVLKDYENNT